jgi:hypothetical protein
MRYFTDGVGLDQEDLTQTIHPETRRVQQQETDGLEVGQANRQ